jgi:hypothetical protein
MIKITAVIEREPIYIIATATLMAPEKAVITSLAAVITLFLSPPIAAYISAVEIVLKAW